MTFAEEKKDDYSSGGSSNALDKFNIIDEEDQIFEDDNDEDKSRVVKFADDEADKFDAQLDKDRSREELLSKITRLTTHLNDLQKQVQFERDKRKKKEKSLLKLAKELKKRNLIKERDEDRFEELEEKKKYLEHHWVLAQKELDQEKALHAKLHEDSQKEYEQTISEEKRKFERTVKENDDRMNALKKAHIEQCEQLGREVWKANQEADRLHNELTARGVKLPRYALPGDKSFPAGRAGSAQSIILFVLGLFSAVYFSTGGQVSEIFTKSGFCAPVMPGTLLDDNSYGSFQGPWWAPESFKEQAFAKFCTDGSSTPYSVEWTRDGNNNKLTVSSGSKVVLKRSTAKSLISCDKLQFWKRNGHSDEVSFDWLKAKK